MNWINAKLRKPEPLTDDSLTFVLISWPGEDDFRDYATIYYSPCDEKWYMNIDDEIIHDYDYWCYITNPTKK